MTCFSSSITLNLHYLLVEQPLRLMKTHLNVASYFAAFEIGGTANISYSQPGHMHRFFPEHLFSIYVSSQLFFSFFSPRYMNSPSVSDSPSSENAGTVVFPVSSHWEFSSTRALASWHFSLVFFLLFKMEDVS